MEAVLVGSVGLLYNFRWTTINVHHRLTSENAAEWLLLRKGHIIGLNSLAFATRCDLVCTLQLVRPARLTQTNRRLIKR